MTPAEKALETRRIHALMRDLADLTASPRVPDRRRGVYVELLTDLRREHRCGLCATHPLLSPPRQTTAPSQASTEDESG